MARCDGQGEKVTRVKEHEGLVYLCNYVVNVVLLKIPATKNKRILKMRPFQYHTLGEKNFEECVQASNETRDSENQKLPTNEVIIQTAKLYIVCSL